MMDALVFGFDIQEVVGNMWYVVLGFIIFDVLTGLLASAKERQINSSINFDGLIRKVGELVALGFLTFLDTYFQTSGNITKVGVGLIIVYEGLSVIENFSRIGVKLKFLTKYFDKDKVGKQDNE